MTDIEKFNLLWLSHAMTAPLSSQEQYYFDGDSKKFFYTKQSFINQDETICFNMIDMPMAEIESKKFLRGIELLDSNSSELVEIPRLNIQDKVAVQLLFLSKFRGVIHEEQLRLDVKQQNDDYRFVLDIVLNKNDSLAPMLPYWDDFKLKTIQYYLEKFTGVIGITLRLTK